MQIRRSANRGGQIGRHDQAKARTGAALVEMALVLPIFVALLLGLVEFGRAIMVGQMVTNAAREGCRQAILDGSTNAAVETFIKDFLKTSAGVANADVRVTTTISNPAAAGQLSGAESRDLITVQVAVPFSKVSYLPPSFLGSASLTAVSAMRHE